MLALLLSDKFCCFGIFFFVFNRFIFSRFSFHHFFVLVFVNEFVIFSLFTIFVFVFVNENHTAYLLISSVAMHADALLVPSTYTEYSHITHVNSDATSGHSFYHNEVATAFWSYCRSQPRRSSVCSLSSHRPSGVSIIKGWTGP